MIVKTRDGRDLYVETSGTGSPVVVFESGMGVSRSMWGAVVPRVAQHTTAVVYDRSGLGRSPAASGERDLAHLVDDHIDLLDHLGPGPFVLVGHSWGGPIVRTVAAIIPERIRGLVLVDQSDEGCDLFFTPGSERQSKVVGIVGPPLARLGVFRLVARRMASSLPEPAATNIREEDGTPTAIRAQIAELDGWVDDLRRLRDDPPELPDVPISIISGTHITRFERKRRPALIEAHRARADALPQGRHVEARRSGHNVPFTEPQLVVDEILQILEEDA